MQQYKGLWVVTVIIALWISSLGACLLTNIDRLNLPYVSVLVLGRTFIQTGLFIVAHDAMHGNLLQPAEGISFAASRRCNDAIGQLAVTLYALLPYRKLTLNHQRHHQFPGQASDPDFHDGVHDSAFAWYLKFMQGYLDRQQQVVLFFGIGAIFLILYSGLHIALTNIFLFWIIPIVLSSIQLFFFGTYLPHRSTGDNFGDNFGESHHITSINCAPIFSFLTCYHFGYHREHHQNPSLPWYHLPLAHQLHK